MIDGRQRGRKTRVMKGDQIAALDTARRCRRFPSPAGRTDAGPDRASRTAPCIAIAAGLSSSWRMAFSTSPLRFSISCSGNAGCITISPISVEHRLEIFGQARAAHRHARDGWRRCSATRRAHRALRQCRRCFCACVPRSSTREVRWLRPSRVVRIVDAARPHAPPGW